MDTPPHLAAHAAAGETAGIPQVLEVRNGDMVSLDEEGAEIVGSTPTGRRLRVEEPRFSKRRGDGRGRGRSDHRGRPHRSSKGRRPSGDRAQRGVRTISTGLVEGHK